MKSALKNLVLLSLILSIVSADKAADKILISEVNFYEGVYKHKDRPVTGEIIDYYENDILKFTYSALEGRLHGEAKEFYANGTIRSTRNYSVNKLFGEFTEYFENGDIKIQFKVGLNAYGQGEKVSDIKIAKEKSHKLKSYDEGILLFVGENLSALGRSEEISILSQSSFKIVDSDDNVLFQH